EVTLRLLVADVRRHVHAQIAARLPAQGAHQLFAVAAAQVALAVAALSIGVDSIAPLLSQCATGTDSGTGRAVRACAQQDFGGALTAGLLADGIDRRPHGAAAIHERARATQDFKALVAPAVAGIAGRARGRAQNQAIFGHAHGIDAFKAPA